MEILAKTKRTALCAALFFFSIQNTTWAQTWMCHETASLKNGNNIQTCGVGEGETEALAREEALINAKKEFYMICQEDLNCKGFKTTMQPMRNSCKKSDKGYKCYRGLDYQITKLRNSKSNLDEIEKELKRKEDEYNLARERYEKKKRIEELEEKIKNKDFSNLPSEYNHFVHIGGQLSFSTISGKYTSSSDLTGSFYGRYIPKKRWAIQAKYYYLGLDEEDPEPSSDDYSFDNEALRIKAEGTIKTISILYFFNDLVLNNPSTVYLGFGIGTANFDYLYSYEKFFPSTGIITEQGDITSKVTYITFGYSNKTLFTKSRELGFEFGIDIYNINDRSGHTIESVVDLFIAGLFAF